jgi:hypothetical protein
MRNPRRRLPVMTAAQQRSRQQRHADTPVFTNQPSKIATQDFQSISII